MVRLRRISARQGSSWLCFFFLSSENQQTQQQVTQGDDAGELIVNHTKSLNKKMDAGQRQVTDQGTTQFVKTRMFILPFPFCCYFTIIMSLMLISWSHTHVFKLTIMLRICAYSDSVITQSCLINPSQRGRTWSPPGDFSFVKYEHLVQ